MLNTLLLISTLAVTIPQTDTEVCKTYSNIAEMIITRRQEHYTKEDMINRLNNSDNNSSYKQTVEGLIEAAYSIPVFPHIHEKLELISKFKSAIFVECLDAKAEEI